MNCTLQGRYEARLDELHDKGIEITYDIEEEVFSALSFGTRRDRRPNYGNAPKVTVLTSLTIKISQILFVRILDPHSHPLCLLAFCLTGISQSLNYCNLQSITVKIEICWNSTI